MKVLKVYSVTCGPCKLLEKNLQAANIPHESIDILSEQGEEVVERYRIRTVPTLLLVDDNGNLIKKHTGLLLVDDLKKFINE